DQQFLDFGQDLQREHAADTPSVNREQLARPLARQPALQINAPLRRTTYHLASPNVSKFKANPRSGPAVASHRANRAADLQSLLCGNIASELNTLWWYFQELSLDDQMSFFAS